MDITVIAFDSCMTSAVYGLLDALALAARLSAGVRGDGWSGHRVRLATRHGRAVAGFGGFRIKPDCAMTDAGRSDVVLVPAILGDIEGVLARERELVDWLAALRRRQTLVASACTGAFLLAEAGLLDGRRVTTNPAYRLLFESRYPAVRLALEQRIVEDRSVICAGSTSAVLDLAVHIVDRLGGHELAVSTAKALSIDRNAGLQLPYLLFVAPRDHGDERVLQAQDFIAARHGEALGVARMADCCRMSIRNFNRRFRGATGMAPLDYLRTVRMESAKRLLENSAAPVEQVADQVGYGDMRAFIRSFGAYAGVSPGQYRRRFRAG